MAGSAAATDVELPIRPGDVLDGRFRIERVIGVGGMGAVYAATHMQLAQRVAIKVILPSRSKEGSKDEVQRLQRLLQEARVVAQMKNPHVVDVLDVGTLDSGSPYMVMELLEGVDFDVHLQGIGVLPPRDAVEFVLQVCEAVAEAHSLGVIHRDLKPNNLFLTKGIDKRPLVKVLDFGLAKSMREESAQTAASITRPLEVIGTPKYMSPEQLRSTRDVDERTDIWSIGVILYEMVSGRLPFDSPSILDLCAAIARDAPPPIAVELPDGLEDVIQKCLQKYPKDRFPRITELAEALAPFTGDTQRIERVRRVQKQDTIPPESQDALSGPVSRGGQVDIATQVVSRGGGESADAIDEDDADLARLRPGVFGLRRLGIPLLVLFIVGMGGGTAFLAMKLLDDAGPARAAPTVPAAAPAPTVAPSIPSSIPGDPAAPDPAMGAAGTSLSATPSSPSAPVPGPRPAKVGARPAPRPPTPATTPTGRQPAPVDTDKAYQSR